MIYLCRNKRNGFVKIGFTNNPKRREKTLQSEEPELVFERIYEGGIAQEDDLHRRFAHRRVRGEWFELFQEDIDQIDKLMTVDGSDVRRLILMDFERLLLNITNQEELDYLHDHVCAWVSLNPGEVPTFVNQDTFDVAATTDILIRDWIRHPNPIDHDEAFRFLKDFADRSRIYCENRKIPEFQDDPMDESPF